MLKQLLIVSLAVLALASCSKDKDTPAYNVSAKINGNRISFNTAVVAEKEDDGKTVTIGGVGGSSGLSISITDDDAVSAGTYTAANLEVMAAYFESSASMFISDDDFTVTITSINDSEVRGTFSGKVIEGATIHNVTEGTFTAKFQ